MLLKRKRSPSEFSSSTATSSPPQKHTFDFNFITGDAFQARRAAMSPTPSHLNSRTMKRFRNGRPSEEEVHQRTLDILYSAQHQLPESDLPLLTTEDDLMGEQQHIDPEPTRNQHSLHRFWNIKSAPRSLSGFSTSTGAAEQPAIDAQCTHCGAGVVNTSYGDSMDVDGRPGPDITCSTCRGQA